MDAVPTVQYMSERVFYVLHSLPTVLESGLFVLCVACGHVNMFVFSQGVELVHGLVLMGPLQVQLDFLHQRNAVSLSDVQLLCFADAILLIWMI